MSLSRTVDRTLLGNLAKLNEGGQGVIYETTAYMAGIGGSAVYKEYLPDVLRSLDEQKLEGAVEFFQGFSRDDARSLLSLAAWPVSLVQDAGKTTGFIMPKVPDQFYTSFKLPSGPPRIVLAEFQHLLNHDSWLRARGIAISDRTRYQLLKTVAEKLNFFHRLEIVVGDLSPKNLLFSTSNSASCYFIDCDAMSLRGGSALPQGETPGWKIREVSQEPLATFATDSYKFGLLALRLLAGDQLTRNIDHLDSSVPKDVRWLIMRSLDQQPRRRPPLTEWPAALSKAANKASSSTAVSTRPSAARTARTKPPQLAQGGPNDVTNKHVGNLKTQRRASRKRVQQRRGSDVLAIIGLLLLNMTVLVPWLIGRFLLRDSVFFKQGADVFDTSIRSAGPYFWSDYLSGLLILGALVAIFLLIRPWGGRTGFVATGVILAIALPFLFQKTHELWASQEKASAVTLNTAEFPFNKKISGACFSDQHFRVLVNGQVLSVGVREVRDGSLQQSMFQSYCNSVTVYRGWRQIGGFTLGDFSLGELAQIDGAFFYSGNRRGPAEFVVLVHTGDATRPSSFLVGFALNKPTDRWRRNLKDMSVSGTGSVANVVRLGKVITIDEELDQYKHRMMAVDMHTGKTAWTLACPKQYLSTEFSMSGSNTMLMTCGTGGVGTPRQFEFGERGKLDPAP